MTYRAACNRRPFLDNANDDAKAFILAIVYSLFLSHPGTAGEGETENTEGCGRLCRSFHQNLNIMFQIFKIFTFKHSKKKEGRNVYM
jgi:hypothetical protein